ncbi:MAG: PD40 domain-containing protein [Caldilineaceae bacterium]|nr:PD40 domain-containing protein [Caldilineaceae bacterium]
MADLPLTNAYQAAPVQGYYRFPALHEETIVFTAEGDLWKVDIRGGQAQRLTTHHGLETHAAIAPDGAWVAFSAEYEGPREVYVMPLKGGRPRRLTYEGMDEDSIVVGWTPDGRVMYSTEYFSTLPNRQLVLIDLATLAQTRVPLSQASEGIFTPDMHTLFFTRLPQQSSNAKRYQGGSVQTLWKFTFPKRKRKTPPEAVPLTADYLGTSKAPMWWDGRLYFLSDRDGTMNLWSMRDTGRHLTQHTFHRGWDMQSPSLHEGRIVYQLGADLRLYTIASHADQAVPITLTSDFEHTRERWINSPWRYLSSVSVAPDGDRVVLTSRGRVFVAPAKQGRLVEVTGQQGVRYGEARFLPDGQRLLMLSDQTNELEFWTAPANGIGPFTQLTQDGQVFRYGGVAAPNGQWIVFTDKNHQLWLLHLVTNTTVLLATSEQGPFGKLAWSPDSQWLAYVLPAANQHRQIWLYQVEGGQHTAITSDRVDSFAPAWSGDGKWLYFLSDRHFRSLVESPWGPRQPEPYLHKSTKVYLLALNKGDRSPFWPNDEISLAHARANNGARPSEAQPEAAKATGEGPKGSNSKSNAMTIHLDGLSTRLYEVPLPVANYVALMANGKFLFWLERDPESETRLLAMEVKNQDLIPVLVTNGVSRCELSLDGKKLMVQKGAAVYLLDAVAEMPKDLEKSRVPLGQWSFAVNPREEWRQMLLDAWRLQRDYFYDRNLHGVPWQEMLNRYLPLVERVTDRQELNDLIAQLMSELSALHTDVGTSDVRRGQDWVDLASLGAELARNDDAGGYTIHQLYRTDPEFPEQAGPLLVPEVNLAVGDTIEAINGIDTLQVAHPALLLKQKAGQQVLLRVRTPGAAESRSVIVRPISSRQASHLRYSAWEYEKRQQVEEKGGGAIGYIHLRAMDGENYSEWARDYFPVFNRQGLIIDVRNNRGGNIDSWLLGKLLRKPWVYWQPRAGKPYWNMHYAFHGHMAVLCNEFTASDGETFAEGFRRLGLGQVIGVRTWGGGIWLTRSNRLVDYGYAAAPEIGMYTADGQWLIEGHGVDPDQVVDNLPHATFLGHDAQLDAAIAHLQTLMREAPRPVPPPPPYPEKGFPYE